MKNNDKEIRRKQTVKLMKKNWLLYVFVLPVLIYIVIFNICPMFGLQIAFKNYTFANGIFGSPWVGLKWFNEWYLSIGSGCKVVAYASLELNQYF